MIKENTDYLHRMILDKRDIYSILSFFSESIDTLRTDLLDYHPSSNDIYENLENLLNELIALDKSLDSARTDVNAES